MFVPLLGEGDLYDPLISLLNLMSLKFFVVDVVTFELINVLNSRFVLKSLNDSVRNPGGKFYKVEKYV